MTALSAKIITVSDSASQGERIDEAGPNMAETLTKAGYLVSEPEVVADGVESVSKALNAAVAEAFDLIVTVGGTGFGQRDLTPEATRLVIEREAPGLAESLRANSPRGLGRLNRSVCGTSSTSLIVNLPGSTKGSAECWEAIAEVVPHISELLAGRQPH